MQLISPKFVQNNRVLLRYDIDVALRSAQGKLVVGEDFKLRAGLGTLNFCLKHAQSVILMGHVGRPEGKVVPELSVEPIRQWFAAKGFSNKKLTILENLRFDPRESFDFAQDKEAVMEFARELAAMGDVYVNEAFSAYRPAVSTTVLPALLPHAVGLRFAQEVKVLQEVRENPKKPFVAIMGGAKVADKLPVINVLAKKADAVLVGGKLVAEIRQQGLSLPKNVMVGKLTEDGFDLAPETVESWSSLISKAAIVVWNGPLGKFEDPKNDATKKVVRMILGSKAHMVIGGGDSIAALSQYGLLKQAEEKAFVSVGGGAMLKFLSEGTLPSIGVLS